MRPDNPSFREEASPAIEKPRQFWLSEHGGGYSVSWDHAPTYTDSYYHEGNKLFHAVEYGALLEEKQKTKELLECLKDCEDIFECEGITSLSLKSVLKK